MSWLTMRVFPAAVIDNFLAAWSMRFFPDVMAVNVVGPLKMAEAFLPHIEASQHKKIMTVSSSQGSITQVKVPMLYVYRASKSAVNMVMRNLGVSIERQGRDRWPGGARGHGHRFYEGREHSFGRPQGPASLA